MIGSLSSQLDKLGFSNSIRLVERAERLYETGKEFIAHNKPWKPLLPEHEFNEMMAIPEARAFLQKAVALCSGRQDDRKRKREQRERVPVRVPVPETLDPEDPSYKRHVSRFKYVRDLLLVAKTHRIVYDYKEYFIMDLPAICNMLRPWYREQWDRARYVRRENNQQ